jgi:hypothetical protein
LAIETGSLKPVAKGARDRLSVPEAAAGGVKAIATEITAVAKDNAVANTSKERFTAWFIMRQSLKVSYNKSNRVLRGGQQGVRSFIDT